MSRTVAILGASANRRKFGNKSVRAHAAAGYVVYPINPAGGEIEGLPVLTTIRDLPISPDRISLYLPPAVGLQQVAALVASGCREIWLNPGTESSQLVQALRDHGLEPVLGCSIIDVGYSPADFPD